MTTVRLLRPASKIHTDPLTGRLLGPYLVSLLIHALLLIGLAGGWLGSTPRADSPPVYTVDLVHKPVLNPQAGRPEPRGSTSTKVESSDELPLPAKNVPVNQAPSRAADGRVNKALAALREEQARKSAIDRLRQRMGQTVPAEIRVGMQNAGGTEEGVDAGAYIQTTLQNNWALSPYLLADSARMARIEAWVVLTYDKSGKLEGYRFEQESGDAQFDESIRRALVKSQRLQQPLPARMEDLRVIFNLKEMNAARRAR
jgi:colicin import membrane protein